MCLAVAAPAPMPPPAGTTARSSARLSSLTRSSAWSVAHRAFKPGCCASLRWSSANLTAAVAEPSRVSLRLMASAVAPSSGSTEVARHEPTRRTA